MEKELIKAMKECLFDRYQGFNNDDEHSWKFHDLISTWEKDHEVVPMEGWRSKEQFAKNSPEGWKQWEDEFPEKV